jgi:peptidoglycan hydrolase-like protein with peptidoglycan-binding domain
MAAMVVPGGIASADLLSDLQAQVNALLAQIAALQGTSSGVPAVCAGVTFTSNLAVGSTGSQVTCLQALLGVLPQSGYFGPITLAAV